jgi:GT2 family glycosyltransferase
VGSGITMEQNAALAASTTDATEEVDCAIVIVTYNSSRYINDLLRSIPSAASGLTTRTIVVDNASDDGTSELVRSWPDVILVEAGANVGYSAAINLGRERTGKFASLLVLNPDVVLENEAIRLMFDALADRAVGIVAPSLLDFNGTLQWSLRREPTVLRALGDALLGARLPHRPGWLSEVVRVGSEYEIQHPIDWATGAAFLISRTCDLVIGPWDERFFLYSEETDFAHRARSAGFCVEYLPQAKVRHRGKGSGTSPKLCALMAVNRVRYMEFKGRNFRGFWAAAVLAEALRARHKEHRTALGYLLRRKKWDHLATDLRT